MKPYANYFFKNGVVVTVDKNNTITDSVAVKDNKIVYVGTEEGAKQWMDAETKVVDLKGRALLPGFIDSHMHAGMRGQNASVILDCNSDSVRTIEELKQIIKEAALKVPEGTWIKATGYEQSKLLDGRHPTRDDLDQIAPNHPVQLTRCCLHMGVYNTRALEIGGVYDPKQFAPGEVVTDSNGRLTGLLKEGACTYMWDKVVYTEEEYMNAFRSCSDILIKYGVTSIHDAGFYGEKTMRFFQDSSDQGIFKPRLYTILYHAYGKEKTKEWIDIIIKTGIHTGLGSQKLKLGPVKILLDGSTSGPSSATKEPYCHDADLKGIQLWEQNEANEIIARAHNAGFQVTAHAVGDAAVEIILTAIEKALEDNPRDHRHRIEHCGIISGNQLGRIKNAGIIPISNPGFFNENAAAYVRFYGDRVNNMFPLKQYRDNDIITAIGSDAPVIEADPMIGIYGAIARQDKRSGIVAGESQKVDLLDVIRMYTYNGAYASMEENIKGSIEVGKLADLIILSENILETPVDRIKNIVNDFTMLDGVVLYERKGI